MLVHINNVVAFGDEIFHGLCTYMYHGSVFIVHQWPFLLTSVLHVEVKYIGLRFVQTLVKKIVQNIASNSAIL